MDILKSIDDIKLYRGNDYVINERIAIKQPTIGEICDYGEMKYFSMVRTLCYVGADLKWQLDDCNVDYTTIDDFTLFSSILAKTFDNKYTSIIFGDILDFTKMELKFDEELQDMVLIQSLSDGDYIKIDRCVYALMIGVLRKLHRLKRNDEIPGNEATRRVLIEEAREEAENNKDKIPSSFLFPLISTMVNSEGFKRDDVTVFDMKIFPFMDSVSRIFKIKNADLKLYSGYSGFGIDLKKIDKEELNWAGEL